MSLFDISDIPHWIVFRGDWLKFIYNLADLQKNLKTKKWTGLGIVYPRFGVIAYVYYLLTWARYCDKTSEIISAPDKSLFAEVFLSYICQIDILIDQRDTMYIWESNNINRIKLAPNIQATASELARRINTLDIPRQRKALLIKQITNYRRSALEAMRLWASGTTQSIEDTLKHKEVTACYLLPQWSNLLSIVYDVPDITAQGVSDIFLNFSFLVQIIDDVSDVAMDYRNNVQNIFTAIAQEHNLEWQKLKKVINQNINSIGWDWVKNNMPDSYKRLKQLYSHYAEQLTAGKQKPEITLGMLTAINRYRGLMKLNR